MNIVFHYFLSLLQQLIICYVHMHIQLQDVETSLDTHRSFEHKAKEYEQNIAVLSQELHRVTEQLNMAEEQASHPPPLLATLQQEIAQMKVHEDYVCVCVCIVCILSHAPSVNHSNK